MVFAHPGPDHACCGRRTFQRRTDGRIQTYPQGSRQQSSGCGPSPGRLIHHNVTGFLSGADRRDRPGDVLWGEQPTLSNPKMTGRGLVQDHQWHPAGEACPTIPVPWTPRRSLNRRTSLGSTRWGWRDRVLPAPASPGTKFRLSRYSWRGSAATRTSVWVKSLPTNSNGSPVSFANA